MNRITFYLVIPAVVGAASIVNAIAFALSRMLNESSAMVMAAAALFGVALVLVAFAGAIRGMRRGRWVRLGFALVVMLIAGFTPRLVDVYVSSLRLEQEQAAGADLEAQFESDLLAHSDDVAARADTDMPYDGSQSLALLEFAADADLSSHDLFDHTPEAFDLVAEAIDDKVLDPNMPMGPATAGDPPETVTLAFYDKRIRPAEPGHIARHDWELLQLLVSKGADISAPEAAPLRAALARKAVPVEGRFVALQ